MTNWEDIERYRNLIRDLGLPKREFGPLRDPLSLLRQIGSD